MEKIVCCCEFVNSIWRVSLNDQEQKQIDKNMTILIHNKEMQNMAHNNNSTQEDDQRDQKQKQNVSQEQQERPNESGRPVVDEQNLTNDDKTRLKKGEDQSKDNISDGVNGVTELPAIL